MSDFKLNSVNWQDGMLLSMRHLKDQNSYFEELGRWYSAEVGDNYGLIKKSPGQPSIKLSATLSGNRLRVEIKRCQAILPCGTYIEYNDALAGGEILKAEIDINETSIPVFIGVNRAEKKLVGDPDPSEEVSRIPYEIPAYVVSLVDPPNLPETDYFQVAKLGVKGSEVSQAPDYFAPCVNISADDRLAAMAVDYRNRMENLLKLSTRAYMAVTTAGGLKGASTALQNAFKETMHFLVYHLASHLDDFIVGRNSMHPSRMIIQFKKLFRVVSSIMNLQPGLKDYLNEKFFNKEHNTDIGTYLSSVDAFLLSEYDHKNIAAQVQMIDGLLGVLRGLMAFLAQTKPEELGEQAVATETLTYQGKTYKNSGLKSTRLEQVGELNYLVMELTENGPMADTVMLINKDIFSDVEWRNMQVRLGLDEARGLGETDPVDIDLTAFGNKIVLHPRDMLQSSAVKQVTLIFRGVSETGKLSSLGASDLILYIV